MLEEEEEHKNTIGGIPFKEAKQMIKNYTQKAARDSTGHITETTSVWFSLTQLREILKGLDADYAIRAIKNPGEETDGLRIYFANYGDNAPELGYKHQNTVVLISTHKTKVGGIEKHKDYFHNEKTSEPQNRGALCPPNLGCDCETDILDPEDRPHC